MKGKLGMQKRNAFARTIALTVFAALAALAHAAMVSCQSKKTPSNPAETVMAISAGKYGPANEIESSQAGGAVFEDSAYVYRFNPDQSLALVEAKGNESEEGRGTWTGEIESRFPGIADNWEAESCARQLLFAAMPKLDASSAGVWVKREQRAEGRDIYVFRISERKEGDLTGNSLLAEIWADGTLERLQVLAFRIGEQEALDIAYASIGDYMNSERSPITLGDFAFFDLSLADRSGHVLNGGLVERRGGLVWSFRIDGIFIAKGNERSFFVDVDAQTGECRVGICR